MSWQPRHTRLVMIVAVVLGLGTAAALTLKGLSEDVTYFYSPSDIKQNAEKLLNEKRAIRIGGLVEKGSITHGGEKGLEISFTVTDLKETLAVRYKGIVPDLFRDGQGVVAEGKLLDINTFEATTLLAKHDEKYMPPEVAKALEKNKEGKDAH